MRLFRVVASLVSCGVLWVAATAMPVAAAPPPSSDIPTVMLPAGHQGDLNSAVQLDIPLVPSEGAAVQVIAKEIARYGLLTEPQREFYAATLVFPEFTSPVTLYASRKLFPGSPYTAAIATIPIPRRAIPSTCGDILVSWNIEAPAPINFGGLWPGLRPIQSLFRYVGDGARIHVCITLPTLQVTPVNSTGALHAPIPQCPYPASSSQMHVQLTGALPSTTYDLVIGPNLGSPGYPNVPGYVLASGQNVTTDVLGNADATLSFLGAPGGTWTLKAVPVPYERAFNPFTTLRATSTACIQNTGEDDQARYGVYAYGAGFAPNSSISVVLDDHIEAQHVHGPFPVVDARGSFQSGRIDEVCWPEGAVFQEFVRGIRPDKNTSTDTYLIGQTLPCAHLPNPPIDIGG